MSTFLSAQTRTLNTFSFQEIDISYSRIDYSKHGALQYFVFMYSENDQFDLIEQTAYDCLRKGDLIYHTLYFFIRVPERIEDPYVKNQLFSEFMTHVKSEEKKSDVDLYLNFDKDASLLYQAEHNEEENRIKRVVINLTTKYICKNVTINQ
ncbi:MAG: hypothetical protein WA775_12405 [Psychroserpens sp.]|uniref:hypothetical protein n=1 Tax=Psychroserpens sp. TaxID=2020870 RepID=UPI003C70B51E